MPLDNFQLIQVAVKIGLAFLLFLLGRWLAGRTRRALGVTLARTPLAPSLARLLILLAYYSILFLTVIVSLALVGFPVAPVLAILLIVVIIVAIALQQSISNLAATVIFMLFQPFKVGELIEGNGVLGTAKEIQLLSTVLVTADNREITIPNSKIQGSNLVNYSRLGRLRANFEFGVSYSDDLEKAKRVVSDVLIADPRVLADPPVRVFVRSLGDSSITIAAWPWATPADFWGLNWDIPQRVKERFDAEGITIPFPQRDVHLIASAETGR